MFQASKQRRAKAAYKVLNSLNEHDDGYRDCVLEAKAMFEALVQEDPDCAKSRQGLGYCCLKLGDIDSALEHFWKNVRDEEARCIGYIGIARCLERQGKVDEAIAFLKRLTTLYPEIAECHTAFAEALARASQYEEAMQAVDVALTRDSTNGPAYASKGEILFAVGRAEEGLHCFQTALKSGYKHFCVNAGIAKSLGALHKHDEALTYALRAQGEAPNEPYVLVWLANCYSSLHRHEEAVECLVRSLEREPGDPDARFNLGNEYVWLGRYGDAAKEYRALLQESPDSSKYHVGLGVALAGLGRHSEAISELDTVPAEDPSFIFSRLSKVSCLLELDRIDDAIALYGEFRDRDEADRDARRLHSEICYWFTVKGLHHHAINAASKALSANPEDAGSLYRLGLAQAHLGEPDAAAETVRKLRKLDKQQAVELRKAIFGIRDGDTVGGQ